MTLLRGWVLATGLLGGGLWAAEPPAWKVAPEALKGLKNPVTQAGMAASVERGRALYATHCASCHGATGKGDGEDAAYYNSAPSNLTTDKVAAQADAELFVKVAQGRGDMTGFGKKLDTAQRWDTVNFVRTLRQGK